MRKTKKKYANLIMLLLIFFVLFYIVIQNRPSKVSVDELIKSYSTDRTQADKKYLNKDLEITGKVKMLIQPDSEKSLLELQSYSEEIQIYCILMSEEANTIANSFTLKTKIIVYGKCLGLKTDTLDNSSSAIYIETGRIK